MKLGLFKLKKHLEDNDIRPSHFAAAIGKYPSTLSRILGGTNSPDLETAELIRQNTGIQLDDWLKDHKR